MPWTEWFVVFEAGSTKPNFSAISFVSPLNFRLLTYGFASWKVSCLRKYFFVTFSTTSHDDKNVVSCNIYHIVADDHWPTICFPQTTEFSTVFIKSINSSIMLIVVCHNCSFLWQSVIEMEECEEDIMSTLLLRLGTYDNRRILLEWSYSAFVLSISLPFLLWTAMVLHAY